MLRPDGIARFRRGAGIGAAVFVDEKGALFHEALFIPTSDTLIYSLPCKREASKTLDPSELVAFSASF